MSIWSRRYRKQRRFIERMKRWPFYEVHGLLVVDGGLYSLKDLDQEVWYDTSDPDFGIWLDSSRNDVSIAPEGLAKSETRARRIARQILEEVVDAWRNRLKQEYPTNTWTLYIADEETETVTFQGGMVNRKPSHILTLYFFNRRLEFEQLVSSAFAITHSSPV